MITGLAEQADRYFFYALIEVAITLIKVKATAVGGKAGVFDEIFGLLDGREAVILEHVFFDDDAVDVVGAAVQPEFT